MRKRYLLITAPLLASLFIYAFYRTEKTVINDLVLQAIAADDYLQWRKTVTSWLPLSDTIIFSLPEGLWVFSITLTSKPFFINLYNRHVDCVMLPLVFSIGLEFLQLFHFTNGRFDILDIAVSIACWIPAAYFFDDYHARENILRPISGKGLLCFATYGIVYLSHVLE